MTEPSNPLYRIKNFEQLIRYLEDELDWPCEEYGFDEITFRYSPAELGIKEEEAAQIKCIYQLRPFFQGQPWGIFFIEFEKKRIPIVLMRRVLSHLVIKKRASANKVETAAWNIDNLLFISAFGEVDTDRREIAFAHFHQEQGELPTLRVLGWDGADTALKMEYVAKTLKEKLHWPQNPKDVETWREQWVGAFRHKAGHVIRTTDALAERLAELARGIRDAAQTLMAHETEKGRLRSLHKAFQTALIHDLSEEDFADTYAQSITYGLLTAAISRTEMSAGQYGTALIAENVTDMVPITNPFLREMLQTFLHAGGRQGGIDFDELGIQDVVELLRSEETDLPAILRDFDNRAKDEDPVIRFYEDFLNAYNKKLKIQRGVFYTPKPMVSYIVRSVHELLKTEFGLEDGLASIITWGEMVKLHPDIKLPEGVSRDAHFVVILDPATGTATFLVEVIDIVHKTMVAKWKKQGYSEAQIKTAWNEYVPTHLLPRLYGYELMMAPYAIAHMKIGLKLYETGYRFGSSERVRIYLTNALEEPSQLAENNAASLFEALGHEAQAVNSVKRNIHFIVAVGNPPYSGQSANASKNADGSWNFIGNLIQDYYKVDGKPLGEKNPKWLQDDYVKFIRFSQWRIKESGIGIVAMITNHGYLDNPTFRGMRQQLMQTFDEIHILDLHGNYKKKETAPDGSKDENVFDIQQGVSICFMLKKVNTKGMAIEVFHADLFGLRDFKYSWLMKNHSDTRSIEWKEIIPQQSFYLFIPQNTEFKAEYEKWWQITKIMPVYNVGIITKRDAFTIHRNVDSVWKTVTAFVSLPPEKARKEFNLPKDVRDWKVDWAQKDLKKSGLSKDKITPVLYRPFDIRYTYYTGKSRGFLGWPVEKINKHLVNKDNIALITSRLTKGEDFAHIQVTKWMTEVICMSPNTSNNGFVFPLYTYITPGDNEGTLFAQTEISRTANFSPKFVREFSENLSLKFVSNGISGSQTTYSPEDIIHYIYAVLHSPAYRSRYVEFLKMDFPHLPLTSNVELFRQLCRLGEELVGLHLLEDERLESSKVKFVKGKVSHVEKGYPKYVDGRVYVNEEHYFDGVAEDVWNFHIGGYQVCHKWLKDRRGKKGQPGITLTEEDITHYQKVVVSLKETIRLMGEVDGVIESHGGWPVE